VAEVAERLDLTPSQVWAREHRMKAKLRQLLESNGG
jgi:DNA-directed RNA polymerase specialized sigma24 family protein